MWNKRCFPDWKQKRPQWWSADDSSSVKENRDMKLEKMDNDEVTALIRVSEDIRYSTVVRRKRDSEPRPRKHAELPDLTPKLS